MSDESNSFLLVVPIVLVLLLSAAVPAYAVWIAAPIVDPALDFYIRLGAAMITGIVGAFLGGYIIQTAVGITNELGVKE